MQKLNAKNDKRNGWYLVTPEDAVRLLASDPVKNRPLSEVNVEKLAAALKGGQFTETGEPIILSHDGRLADGQHRLTASVKTGRPIETFVVYMPARLGATFFDALNQGKSRSASDRIAIEGGKNATLTASVVRHLVRYERGWTSGKSAVNQATIRRAWEASREEVAGALEFCMPYAKDVASLIPLSALTFCHLMARRVNENKAADWTTGIATGEKLERTSPMLKVRKLLQQERLQRGTVRRTEKSLLGLLIKSWVLFNHGDTERSVIFRQDEDLPKFDAKPARVRSSNGGSEKHEPVKAAAHGKD